MARHQLALGLVNPARSFVGVASVFAIDVQLDRRAIMELARLKAKGSKNPGAKDAISNLEAAIRERDISIALYTRRDRY